MARTTRQVAKEGAADGTAGGRRRAATRAMSDEHKHALAAGRREGAAVKAYLEMLETSKPKRGRRRSPEGLERRLAAITKELVGAAPLTRLLLTQERRDLEQELQRLKSSNRPGLQELEDAFTAHASSYGRRKQIDYQTWRDVGVPDAVLKRAGIERAPGKRQSRAESAEAAGGSMAPKSRAASRTRAAKTSSGAPTRRRTRTSAGR